MLCRSLPCALVLVLGPACHSRPEEATPAPARYAVQLDVRSPADDAPWQIVQAQVMESLPIQHALLLRCEYPTAGWDVEAGRPRRVSPGVLRVDLVESPPEGAAAQVVTPQTVRVVLGTLQPGVYRLEIWRRGKGEPESAAERVQTIELAARA